MSHRQNLHGHSSKKPPPPGHVSRIMILEKDMQSHFQRIMQSNLDEELQQRQDQYQNLQQPQQKHTPEHSLQLQQHQQPSRHHRTPGSSDVSPLLPSSHHASPGYSAPMDLHNRSLDARSLHDPLRSPPAGRPPSNSNNSHHSQVYGNPSPVSSHLGRLQAPSRLLPVHANDADGHTTTEEARKAEDQVEEHFEKTFNILHNKQSHRPLGASTVADESRVHSMRAHSQENFGLMGYGSSSQVSPYGQDIPGRYSRKAPGPPPPLTSEHVRPSSEPEARACFPSSSPLLGPGIIRPLLHLPNIENHSNHNTTPKMAHSSYGLTPVTRVKVSSPAPPQIYGKPTISGAIPPQPYDDNAPLSLTSKSSTRLITAPPTSKLTTPDMMGRDRDFTNMYTSPNPLLPNEDDQIQPLNLVGKRKSEQLASPPPLELQIKRVKNESIPSSDTEVLNLVMGEADIKIEAETKPFPDKSPSSPNSAENGDTIKVEVDFGEQMEEDLKLNETTPPTTPIKIEKVSSPATPMKIEKFSSPTAPVKTEKISSPFNNIETTESATAVDSVLSSVYSGSPTKKGGSASLSVHKGKKAFLQRHSGQDPMEDGALSASDNETGSMRDDSNSPATNGLEISNASSSSTSRAPVRGRRKGRSKTEPEPLSNGHESSGKGQPSSSESEEGTKNTATRPRRGSSRHSKTSKNSETESESGYSEKELDSSTAGNSNPTVPTKKRGRKPKSDSTTPTSSPAKKVSESNKFNPFKRPAVHLLKQSGQSFVQDVPCTEFAPKLGRCRDCKVNVRKVKETPETDSGIFSDCRFFAFRKLKYQKTKKASLTVAGFCDPFLDPFPSESSLWVPSKEHPPESLELEMAKFLVDQLGDQLCELIRQELDAVALSVSKDTTVAWKRLVKGVREICDVCSTTLFNFHWACRTCGFVVCIACYGGRKDGIPRKMEVEEKDRDEFQWQLCRTGDSHDLESLMLTQIIARDSMKSLGVELHKARAEWGIPQACGCELLQEMIASETKEGNELEEASKIENVVVNPLKEENNIKGLTEISASKPTSDSTNNSLGKLYDWLGPNAGMTSIEEKKEALPPPAPAPKGDRPIPVLENKDEELKHFVRRTDAKFRCGKTSLPVRTYSQRETNSEYPGVPHRWLSFGRLLHLRDPLYEGNQKIFQEVWKRGLPVIVSNVSDRLKQDLWSPESFAKDFSELKNDLINCMTGKILAGQSIKQFWDGFENVSQRIKDDKGEPMLLKLKDWPPTEDFAKCLPSRFVDLMENLPLPEYTQRSGRFNLAARLPDNFVKPDLGPKMYIAYGSGLHLEKGTTNLHLDISDAVNLMVHVGIPKDVNNEEDLAAVQVAIEQSDVDAATIARVKNGDLPGALWHIYNSRDADKIRDLLNKVAVERGTKLEADHDPIHDQSWYLDKTLRKRLIEEYNVNGFPIVQFRGDAVFIPAGAPHQVRNLHNCIKIAEDFVSPENVSQCFALTEEFRNLTDTHSNHEDKLQIKNIIFHAVKDAISVLSLNKRKDTLPQAEAAPPTSSPPSSPTHESSISPVVL